MCKEKEKTLAVIECPPRRQQHTPRTLPVSRNVRQMNQTVKKAGNGRSAFCDNADGRDAVAVWFDPGCLCCRLRFGSGFPVLWSVHIFPQRRLREILRMALAVTVAPIHNPQCERHHFVPTATASVRVSDSPTIGHTNFTIFVCPVSSILVHCFSATFCRKPQVPAQQHATATEATGCSHSYASWPNLSSNSCTNASASSSASCPVASS